MILLYASSNGLVARRAACATKETRLDPLPDPSKSLGLTVLQGMVNRSEGQQKTTNSLHFTSDVLLNTPSTIFQRRK